MNSIHKYIQEQMDLNVNIVYDTRTVGEILYEHGITDIDILKFKMIVDILKPSGGID